MYTFKCSVCLRSFPTSSISLVKSENTECSECRKFCKKKKKEQSTDNSPKDLLKIFYGNLQSISTNGTKKYFNKHKLKNKYYTATWIITEAQPLYLLEGFDKRGWKDYHLDHIIPISYGYKNDIPPVLIGSIQNLQFISSEKNLQKRDTLTKKGDLLLLEWRRKGLL